MIKCWLRMILFEDDLRFCGHIRAQGIQALQQIQIN